PRDANHLPRCSHSLLATAGEGLPAPGRGRPRRDRKTRRLLKLADYQELSMATGTVVDVVMPQMGVSVSEGTVTRWLKQVGEHIEADETIVEISTDKVDTEIPSPASGIVREILANEGDTVPVNTRIAVIATGDDAATAPADPVPSAAAPAEEAPVAAREASPAPAQPAPAPPPTAESNGHDEQ